MMISRDLGLKEEENGRRYRVAGGARSFNESCETIGPQADAAGPAMRTI
jgi:hypothetical protein